MTTKPTAKPTPQPALQQLLDLAAHTRPDIDRRELEGALVACHDAGWSWGRTMVEAVRMLAQGEDPHILRDACRDPLGLRKARRRP